MSFRTEFTEVADMEVQGTFLWLLGRSPQQVGRWQEGLEQVVESLAAFPTRCPLAPENDAFEADVVP